MKMAGVLSNSSNSTFVAGRCDGTSTILNQVLSFPSFNIYNNTNNNTINSGSDNDLCSNGDPVVSFNQSGTPIVISTESKQTSNNAIYGCEFETELLKYGDIFNGYYLRLYPTPIVCQATFNFINSRPRLREQLALKNLFDIVRGKYDLNCDLNNVCEDRFNENFYKHEYCYSPVASAPTSQIIIILNDTGVGISRIDTELHENDILKGVYGVVWDENNIINGISSGM